MGPYFSNSFCEKEMRLNEKNMKKKLFFNVEIFGSKHQEKY